MASLWITEFSSILANGAGLFPAVGSQVIEYAADEATHAKPFNRNTIMIRVNVDTPCLLSIGLDGSDDPQVVRMNAGTEYFGVSGSLTLSVKALI